MAGAFTARVLCALRALEADLRCPVCLFTVTSPVVPRHCGHAFCRPCMTEALNHAQTCPVCLGPASEASLENAPAAVAAVQQQVAKLLDGPDAAALASLCDDGNQVVAQGSPVRREHCKIKELDLCVSNDNPQSSLALATPQPRLTPRRSKKRSKRLETWATSHEDQLNNCCFRSRAKRQETGNREVARSITAKCEVENSSDSPPGRRAAAEMIGRAGSCDGRFRSDRGAGTTTPRPGIESLAAPTDSMATLLGSSLAPEAQSRLDQLETMLIGAASGSATVVCVFSDAVTHVIMPCTSKGTAPRTMKYLLAVTAGRWVVGQDYISACLRRKTLVDPTEYEIVRDTSGYHGACRRARLSGGMFPFRKIFIFLLGAFAHPLPSAGEVKALITKAGCTVVGAAHCLANGHNKLIQRRSPALSQGLGVKLTCTEGAGRIQST
eukprot:GHVT01022917.1.p1 GENE.GHVT01022917.1~~GHVT01022917.1.p1  ORF type:complete len:439 (-),score=44.22 GHVT01022917.1:860-2176(-)